jgi:hypothetical protein
VILSDTNRPGMLISGWTGGGRSDVAKARKAIPERLATSRAVSRTIGFWDHCTIAELASAQKVKPLTRVEDLAANLWESSDDLEAFLADVYQARNAGAA